MSDRISTVVDLMRRMPPQKISSTLVDVISLADDLLEDILASIDQPLTIMHEEPSGRDFISCEYNRDADSYRSPHSNKYYPPFDDGSVPSDALRKLEISFNNAFDIYRTQYYRGGISSVYLWDTEQGFAGAILIKKASDDKGVSGCWDSIHVITVTEQISAKLAHYSLTSTIMLWLQTENETSGYYNLGGSLTRCDEQHESIDTNGGGFSSSHIKNIGQMIENAENKIRNSLNELYFGTSRKIATTLRTIIPASEEENRRKLMKEVNTALQKK